MSLQLGTELGADGLTMRAIAKRLGVSATALYQHFESKAAILRAIRFQGLDILNTSLAPAFELDDPLERLVDHGRRYIRFALDNPWLYSLLLDEEELDWASMAADELQAIERSGAGVARAIEDGKLEGIIRPDLDQLYARHMMWASFHGLASLMLRGRIREDHPAFPIPDADALIDQYVRSVIRGLGP